MKKEEERLLFSQAEKKINFFKNMKINNLAMWQRCLINLDLYVHTTFTIIPYIPLDSFTIKPERNNQQCIHGEAQQADG